MIKVIEDININSRSPRGEYENERAYLHMLRGPAEFGERGRRHTAGRGRGILTAAAQAFQEHDDLFLISVSSDEVITYPIYSQI